MEMVSWLFCLLIFKTNFLDYEWEIRYRVPVEGYRGAIRRETRNASDTLLERIPSRMAGSVGQKSSLLICSVARADFVGDGLTAERLSAS